MVIHITTYLNSKCSSNSDNFFVSYPDKGITYSSSDGVTPYVSPFDSHVNRDPKHPHRPAFGMSMNESIFSCKKDIGDYGRNDHHKGDHQANDHHNGRADHRDHKPIPLVPTTDKPYGFA